MSEPAVSSRPVDVSPDTDLPPILPKAHGSRWHRWVWLVLAIALLPVLILLFSFNPAHHGFYPMCVFYRVTGLQCPGCGGLRAAHHLLHGEIITAFRFNQLFVLALPVLAVIGVRRMIRGEIAKPIPPRTQARWAWISFVILLLFWIVRNLPLEVFKLPTE